MESKGKRAPRATGPAERSVGAAAAAKPFGEAVTPAVALAPEVAAPIEIPAEAPASAATLEPDLAQPIETAAEAEAPGAAPLLPPSRAKPAIETVPGELGY